MLIPARAASRAVKDGRVRKGSRRCRYFECRFIWHNLDFLPNTVKWVKSLDYAASALLIIKDIDPPCGHISSTNRKALHAYPIDVAPLVGSGKQVRLKIPRDDTGDRLELGA